MKQTSPAPFPLKSDIILTAMQELSLPYQNTDAKLSQLATGPRSLTLELSGKTVLWCTGQTSGPLGLHFHLISEKIAKYLILQYVFPQRSH